MWKLGYAKGITLLDIGEDYDAQVCLNKAVKLSPKSFKARYNRGKCLLKLKYYDEAILDFQQAISTNLNMRLPTNI